MYHHNQTAALNKYKVYLPGLVAVLIGLVGLYYSFQTIVQIFETREQIEISQNRSLQLTQRLERVEALRAGELSEIETIVSAALPNQKPIFNSYQGVTEVATDKGVAVSNFQANPGSLATPSARINPISRASRDSGQNNFEALHFDIGVKGSLTAINEFLLGVYEILPLMDLKTMRVSTSTTRIVDDTPTTDFSSELEIEAYWMADLPIPRSSGAAAANARIEELSTQQIELLENLSDMQKITPIEN